MICNKPSLLPVWTDPTTTMFIEPASFSGVDKCGGCRTIWNLRLIIVLPITLWWNYTLDSAHTEKFYYVSATTNINHEWQSTPTLIVESRYELTLLSCTSVYLKSYQHAGSRSHVIFVHVNYTCTCVTSWYGKPRKQIPLTTNLLLPPQRNTSFVLSMYYTCKK